MEYQIRHKDSANRKLYNSLVKKRIVLIVVMLIGLAFLAILNISIGSSSIAIQEILSVLFAGGGDGHNPMIIKEIRLPMALMAMVIGGALGIGGCGIQTILRNPIASPFTLGISAAASFGAAMGLILNANLFHVSDTLAVTVNAFAFSLLVAVGIYTFSRQRNISKTAIILFGIALNFLFNALTMILQYIADEDELQSLIFWTFGSLLKTTWNKFFIVFAVLVVCYLLLFKDAWKLTAMTLDDTKAKSLGVDTAKVRRKVIFVTSLLSTVAVCFVGTIGFVGLIAPHIARQLVGEDQRFFMPLSALIGAFIMSFAFVVSKVIIKGVILPIGLITAVIGIPFFVAIIFTKMRTMQ
ncbi:iron complex transport system permease protein [Desulfotomaculum arcticum]|uniref:Iron complex transport system permease protein n=1 Tax=Desulfotruncus arcticus DSM 17038 TaxID=1121424 RepID=A0A1I2R2Q9_9FIRM|nr:iron ABC transporter permease [Desulfotruncus arcticus]SFG34670.1 iron complex transport system permease protein [Desulfotomaculum arcticum] [Desulfotruncus arcticus DSM 17038]